MRFTNGMRLFVSVSLALALALVSSPALAEPSQHAAGLSGKVVETMNSGGYTYVLIATEQGNVWAAGPQVGVAVGGSVTTPAR